MKRHGKRYKNVCGRRRFGHAFRLRRILLHYGHGWLMNNSSLPFATNVPTLMGGSVENRCRYPLEVIKAIRNTIGYDMIIEVRLNGDDKKEGGITPDDCAQQALIFQDYVDMIHVSCGTRLMHTPVRRCIPHVLCLKPIMPKRPIR